MIVQKDIKILLKTAIITMMIIIAATEFGYSQISGTVFRDLPVTGLTQNTYGVKEANEPGVEGVTVTVYPGGASTTTASDGTYTIAATGAVRIEFSGWPSYMKESADGGGVNSSVQFVTAPASNVDFGLYIPSSYSDLNIDIMTSVAVSGDPNGGGTSASEGSVIFHDYTATGDYDSPVGPSIINFGEVGSTFGGAWQSKTKTYFLAAYAKRYVGFKSDPGSVFRIDNPSGTPTVSEYFSLDALGFSTGVIPPRTDLPADKGPSHDIDMFGLTGTVSLGDIELDLEQENLYIVNLYDKKLYKVNIGNPVKAIITAADVTSFAIPDPGCTNGNWRPFALGLDESRNVLMIGGVCDAATGDRSDLHAYLYEFDLNTQTMGVTSVLDFALDFQRGDTWGSHPVPPITNHWNIWSDEPSDWLNAAIPSISVLRTHPEPLLADIEFETDGSMILGFRDIWGDRFGAYNYAPEQNNTNAYSCHANGDLYKVKKIAGVYELENNGGFSDGTAGCGVGNGDGPGGGEFYCDDNYSAHANVPQGGLAYLMGEEHFVAESMDPHTVDSGGSRWMSNTPGNSTQGYQYYKTNNGSSGTFAKASGTGDVELLTAPAPIEIGNLVWLDTNGDGIQDAGEAGIAGVEVKLYQGANLIATATTDTDGHYIFSNDPNGTSTASHIYNIIQLVEGGVDYMVVIEDVDGANKQAALGNTLPTDTKTGEGANHKSNDSNGVFNGTSSEATVASQDIQGLGNNNHSYDFGFEPLPNCDNTPELICDDGSDTLKIIAQVGLTNVIWYNSAGDQVGTGDTLLVDSNTSGMADGSDNYYYEGIGVDGCTVTLCCHVYVETQVCCSITETHSSECNDNGTPADETDDYFSLTVTGTMTGGSGNYVVKIGTYTSPSTASGTAITIDGDGQGGNPTLAADGTSTYVVRVEDATNSNCFVEFTTDAVDECSECPAPDCLKTQVKKNN